LLNSRPQTGKLRIEPMLLVARVVVALRARFTVREAGRRHKDYTTLCIAGLTQWRRVRFFLLQGARGPMRRKRACGLSESGTVMLRIERQGQRVLAWTMLFAMLALALWMFGY
jgi:hypothetical protein